MTNRSILIPSLLIMLLIGVMVGLISRDGLSSMAATMTRNQDSLTVHRISDRTVRVECEDEREPVVERGVNRTRITVTCGKGD